MSTTKLYDTIREEVTKEYAHHSSAPKTDFWNVISAKWRNRVGIPRLTAETAALRAHGVLNSINLSSFRNQPELEELLIKARNATLDLTVAITEDNWRRFDKEQK